MKRTLLISVALLALLVAGWLLGRPLYRDWREQRAVQQARRFLAQADLRSAVLATRQTLALNQNNLEATRLMAAITESVYSPTAMQWRRRVAELQPDNLTNHLQLARTAMMFRDFTGAAAALASISEDQRNHPAYHQLNALLALARNDLAETSLHLSEVARLSPENKLVQLNLAVLGLQNTNAPLTEAAVQSLRELATLPEWRAEALRQLALHAIFQTNRTEAVTLTRELQSLADASIPDRLLHLKALLEQGEAAAFEDYLHKLQAHCESVTNGFGALTLWLIQAGKANEAERWLAALSADLQNRQEIKLARADSGLARKDWSGLASWLENDNWSDSEFLRHVLLARVKRETGSDLAAQAEWRAALQGAEAKAQKLLALVRLSAAWDWKNEHEEVLWLLVQRHPAARWATDALTQAFLRSGNTPGLQKLYSELVAREPENLAVRNNLAAVCLLLKLQLQRAHDLARSTYLRARTNAAFASTYAYSLHLQGSTAEGLAVLDDLPPSELEQPAIALYYGLLQSSVAPEKAEPFLTLAGTAKLLLPEERALLQTARRDN